MPLLQHHVEEFKALYKQHFGEALSNDEAWAMATKFVHLLRLLLTEVKSTTKSSAQLLSSRLPSSKRQ